MNRSAEELVADGQLHFRAGEFDQAAACYDEALKVDPRSPPANAAMGALRAQQRYFPLAASFYLRAERGDPSNANYPWTAGRLHLRNYTPEDGIAALLRARALDDTSLGILLDIGRAYDGIGAPEQAVPYLREARRLAPDDPIVAVQLGGLLTKTGDFEGAEECFRAAIDMDSDPAYALFSMALFQKHQPGTPLFDEVLAELDRATPNSREARLLHQAAARIQLDLKNYDESFRHTMTAKRISPPEFDRKQRLRLFEDTKRIFTREFLDERRHWGDISEVPVFMVGMPRSGSTLLETIISGHSNVVSLGERNYVDVAAHSLWYGNGAPNEYERQVSQLNETAVAALAADYLNRTRMLTPLGRYATNKMLHNYQHIGLIMLMFPRARIIHCRRSPLDSCYSIFTNPIEQTNPYANKMDDLAWQYSRYSDLMRHWAEVVPEAILDVDYEDVVVDIRAQTERVLDFLSLPWDEECLNFQRRDRTVQTMSRHQVRQGLYRSSVDRWRPHAKFLKPLIDGLLRYGVIDQDDLAELPTS